MKEENDYKKILQFLKHEELSAIDVFNLSNIKKEQEEVLASIKEYKKSSKDFLNEVLNFYD